MEPIKGGRRLRRRSLWLVGGLALVVAVGLSVYLSQSRQSSPSAGLPASGESLSMAAVGRPASEFSLPDQYGQTYRLSPGDGKNHVLVFYMGNF